jgi:thiamine-monophosphate kinase
MTPADRKQPGPDGTGAPDLPEFKLIDRLFAARGRARADVSVGIGDDAALTRPPRNGLLVTATDSLVAGTHFLPEQPAESVGHRCLATNLSDLAAMGAEPLWANLALHLPEIDHAWLDKFAEGFFALADRFDVALTGGDTVRGPLAVTVTVQGTVPEGAELLRSGARTGDDIYASGQPGSAAAGRVTGAAPESILGQACLYPEPRLVLGKALRGTASAMIDISDGLHADLCQLMHASGKGAVAHVDALALGQMVENRIAREDAIEFALTGGEDLELLFTAPAAAADAVTAIADRAGCTVTRIGEVAEGSSVTWERAGRACPEPPGIFRHF